MIVAGGVGDGCGGGVLTAVGDGDPSEGVGGTEVSVAGTGSGRSSVLAALFGNERDKNRARLAMATPRPRSPKTKSNLESIPPPPVAR
jgi:hypothetical protein